MVAAARWRWRSPGCSFSAPYGLTKLTVGRLPIRGRVEEVGLVLQVVPARLARRVVGEVVERLMVVLEQRPGVPASASSQPPEYHAQEIPFGAQPVADVGVLVVVDQRHVSTGAARRLAGWTVLTAKLPHASR